MALLVHAAGCGPVCPEVAPFAATFGYDLTAPDTPDGPVSETGLAYIERLINELREKNGLPAFRRGAVDLGPEGDQLDRALFALRQKKTVDALAYFDDAVRLRPGLRAIYATVLKNALIQQQDDAALHVLNSAAAADMADAKLINLCIRHFDKRGARAP